MVRSCVGQEDQKASVRSTGEDTITRARGAQELALSLLKSEKPVEREYSFGHFALKLLHRPDCSIKLGAQPRLHQSLALGRSERGLGAVTVLR